MKTRAALTFVLITIVIDAMGIGLILPVMPDLIQEVTGDTLANAALWGGVLTTSFAVMQFLFSPTLGNLSDRYGRRPVILISIAVMSIDYLVMAVAGTIWLLLLGRIVGGITAATQSTAAAFIADISKPEEKAARFGLVGAAFGAGFVLGPVVGGLLAEFGTRAPFYAAAALSAANLVFGYLVLPETVTDRIRRPFQWTRANPLGALKEIQKIPEIARLAMLFFVYQVAFTVYPAIWAYYTTASFNWAPATIGASLAAFGISMAIVQGILIGPMLKLVGDQALVVYGMVFNFFAFIALAITTVGWIALILTPLTALGAVVNPALQGRMSRMVDDDAQGELQGVLTSAAALAMVVSPLVMTFVFSAFTAPGGSLFFPGAPFVVSASLMVVCLALFLGSRPATVS
ncbi:MAG: TCR/Tet family MFS transporter [Pseudomonadota bacterium]